MNYREKLFFDTSGLQQFFSTYGNAIRVNSACSQSEGGNVGGREWQERVCTSENAFL